LFLHDIRKCQLWEIDDVGIKVTQSMVGVLSVCVVAGETAHTNEQGPRLSVVYQTAWQFPCVIITTTLKHFLRSVQEAFV
jgi:hypothetical protein